MPKKKKKSRRRNSPGRAADSMNNHAELPEWSDPGELAAYWADKLGTGFVPVQAQESLDKALKADLTDQDRRKLEALALLTADPLGESRNLSDAPTVPVSALYDSAGGRLFVAGAAGEGLACLEFPSGRKLWHLEADQVYRPGGMALAGEVLLVCDRWKHRVLAVSAADGTPNWTLETIGEKDRLDEPTDITLVEKTEGEELWVTDRSNHRICRFSIRGRHLGNLGRRGLAAEEIIWNNTRTPNAPEAVFMEFPETVAVATDIDKEKTVFVWDSGNVRVLCFSTSGELKRIIRLETGAPAGHRHPLRFCLIDSPAGPVPAAIDETDTALMLWSPQGDLVLRTIIGPALFGRSSRIETARLIASEGKDDRPPALVTSTAAVVEFKKQALDLPALLKARAAVQPDQPRWRMALLESRKNTQNKSEILNEFWFGPPNGMDAQAIARSLLLPEQAADGRLSLNLARIEALIEESGRAGFAQAAAELSRAVDTHLETLAVETQAALIEQALPNEVDLDVWSEALAAMDLALFQNMGHYQAQALRRDSTLETMQRFSDSMRRSAWSFRTICRELTRREKDPTTSRQRDTRLASRAGELLWRRFEELRGLEQQLDFNSEPNQVRQEELTAIHRRLVTVKSLGQAAAILADQIAASLNGREPSAELAAELHACAHLAPRGRRWERLYGKTGGSDQKDKHLNLDQPAGAGRPAEKKVSPRTRLKLLRSLIKRMENYLKNLNGAGAVEGNSAKILNRQKEIFALKAVLLIAVLNIDRHKSRELDKLTERAQILAGTSWDETVRVFMD